jgi:hypothetical protein
MVQVAAARWLREIVDLQTTLVMRVPNPRNYTANGKYNIQLNQDYEPIVAMLKHPGPNRSENDRRDIRDYLTEKNKSERLPSNDAFATQPPADGPQQKTARIKYDR